jgi:hypothetical protein
VLLKDQGYATGQFVKNHFGDRDEHLPTNHGFEEFFFGNLCYLNAEEEPENEDYPKNPEFRKKLGPRGVVRSWANADGTQKIEDSGLLTKKRMETVDDETSDRAIEFIREQHAAGKPVGMHMHIGRRPIAAFGNSDGDLQMLQWTTAGSGPGFGLIVHHTDLERQYAYDRQSAFARLDKALDEAKTRGWTVVDMKRDWKFIYPSEKK